MGGTETFGNTTVLGNAEIYELGERSTVVREMIRYVTKDIETEWSEQIEKNIIYSSYKDKIAKHKYIVAIFGN